MNRLLLFAFVLLLVSQTSPAQEKLTEHTFRLKGESAKARLSHISWLTGIWTGEGLGGKVDETWGPSLGGTMVGTFRLIQNDKLVFSEFFMMIEVDSTLTLKLKHFDPLLNGWEEKDKYVEFKLIRVDGQTAYFDGLTYKLDAEGKLHAYVAMKNKDGTFREGEFVFDRFESGSLDNKVGNKTPIKLPMNSDTVVLEYDIEGGFRAPNPAGFVKTPALRVFADGRVLSGRNNPRVAESSYTISDDELRELLGFVVKDNNFYEIESDSLIRQIKETGRSMRIMDAGTVTLKSNLPRGSHQVESYALTIAQRQFPEVKDLQKLEAIRLRLHKMRARAALGDETNAKRVLKEANRQLSRKQPGFVGFSLDDLQYADLLSDGKLTAAFEKKVMKDGKTVNVRASVTRISNQYKVEISTWPEKS